MKNNNISTRDKFYLILFYNRFLKDTAIFLLNSPWFVNNSVYQYFYKSYIGKIISKYRQAPNTVVIENTNICNSRCLMCPHSVMKRKQGVMKENVFKKVVDECARMGVEKVNIHNFGEPLVDKNFVTKVKYAKSKGIPQVGTSTNASLLTKSISREIISSGLDGINFSLDAYSKTVYEKIRVGLPYERVMKNVKEFIEIRNKMNKKKPFIVVDFIVTELNREEIKIFFNEWKNIVDRVNITTLHTWGGLFKGKAGKEKFHFLNPKLKREPCRFLWTDMIVNWNGRVSACCQDYEAKMMVGNAATQSLKDIWQGKVLNELRKKHLSGQMNNIPLCSKCDYHSVWWLFK